MSEQPKAISGCDHKWSDKGHPHLYCINCGIIKDEKPSDIEYYMQQCSKLKAENERLNKQVEEYIYLTNRVLNECNFWDNQPLFDALYKLLPKEPPFIREILS